jgi:hypothetical protein
MPQRAARFLAGRGHALAGQLAHRLEQVKARLAAQLARTSRLFSTSDVRPSRTSMPASATTAAAASSEKLPAKMPRRRKKTRSSGRSRSRLHSIVARRVWCRSGRSRLPPVSSAKD